MKVVLVTIMAVATVYSAPVLEDETLSPQGLETSKVELQREKRSSYPAPVYAPPCGAASAPHISLAPPATYGLHVPPPAHYGLHAPPVHGGYGGYEAPHQSYPSYGYAPHYRSDEENDMLNFSDLDHMTMSRAYGYEAPPHAHFGLGGGHALAASGAAGPAYGIFPHANVGGCAVPLLLSCAPQITAGKIVKSHHSSYGPEPHFDVLPVPASAPQGPVSYREVDNHMMKEALSTEDQHNQHLASQETMASTHDTSHMNSVHS